VYLYLVRHGEAKSKEQDPERPLTETGSENVRRVAALLGGIRLSVGGIHHSTKLRARQTAEILAAGSGAVAPVTEVPSLEPLADVEELAESLSRATTDLMLVGHLPHLDRLASRLVAGDAGREVFSIPACGVLCLHRRPGSESTEGGAVWTVCWMLDPGALPRSATDLLAAKRSGSQGRLAAALSHELNNPLAVLAAGGQMIERLLGEIAGRSGDPDAVARLLGDAEGAAEMSREALRRISRLVARFERLIHLDADATQRRPVDVNALLNDAVTMLSGNWGARIRVIKEYAELPKVIGHPAGLSEVFEDLLDNAATAIEDEGEVRLTTHLERGYVWVRIADTGRGMDTQKLNEIFEPSFRVKEGRVATSWGLYTWRQIIQDHGGDLRVSSEPNRGTKVEISLPAGVGSS
jgi:phosphohistidine phosphatase SixA